MLWSSCQSIDEFYDKSIGVPVQLLPTVLGLKLAVDLELGGRYVRRSYVNILLYKDLRFACGREVK